MSEKNKIEEIFGGLVVSLKKKKADDVAIIGSLRVNVTTENMKTLAYGKKDITRAEYERILQVATKKNAPLLVWDGLEIVQIIPVALLKECIVTLALKRS